MTAGAPTPHSKSLRAVVALLLVTFAWGWTFVWMKQALLAAQRVLGEGQTVASVGLFMLLRFALAAALLAFLPAARRGLDGRAWSGGFLIGGLLLGGFLLQMFGLEGVSPAVSAFLTSLYVLFTALLVAARRRKPMGWWLVCGALLATFGAGFISGPPQIHFSLSEWLTVGCGFIFALHILATEAVTKRVPPMPVTLTSFIWVSAGSAVTLLLGAGGEGPGPRELLRLALDSGFLVPLLGSSIFATLLALTLMNLYQRELDAVRAAILYALEPIWAALIALSLGLADANGWLWIGGGALLLGNLLAELGPLLAARRRASAPEAATLP